MERERLIDAIKVKTVGLIHGISNDFLVMFYPSGVRTHFFSG